MAKKLSKILLLSLVFFLPSSNASLPISKINETLSMDFQSVLKKYQSKNLLAGDIFVSKKNKVLFHRRIVSDNKNDINIGPNTLFPLASITKQFTAVAILLLHKDEKLDLHKPIINYLPSRHYIWKGKVPSWAYGVTIHHLLTHSSGIANYTDINYNKAFDSKSERDTLAVIISSIKNIPLKFKPGEKFDYNNTGYLLLSIIAEDYSPERNFSKFLYNRIFGPLGMKHTYLPDVSTELSIINNISSNKNLSKRFTADLENPKAKLKPISDTIIRAPLMGTGGLISTRNDLVKWNRALYKGKILPQKYLKLMLTPHIEGRESPFMVKGKFKYGYGILILDKDREKNKKDNVEENDNKDDKETLKSDLKTDLKISEKVKDKDREKEKEKVKVRENENEDVIYSHSGWLNGIRTELSYSPKTDTTVILLSNLSPDKNLPTEKLSRQIRAFTDLSLDLLAAANNYR